mmetsp:Transcript_16331/g.26442  ORF Transcript_16331/g.26442 Transcript_16331/m.26442 type:complete len:152 (+) Transcript_16331:624-1079(+)
MGQESEPEPRARWSTEPEPMLPEPTPSARTSTPAPTTALNAGATTNYAPKSPRVVNSMACPPISKGGSYQTMKQQHRPCISKGEHALFRAQGVGRGRRFFVSMTFLPPPRQITSGLLYFLFLSFAPNFRLRAAAICKGVLNLGFLPQFHVY